MRLRRETISSAETGPRGTYRLRGEVLTPPCPRWSSAPLPKYDASIWSRHTLLYPITKTKRKYAKQKKTPPPPSLQLLNQ